MGNIVFVIHRPARQVLAAGMRTVVTGGGGTGAVDSVNGQTGVVVLTATDVGADTAGTGASQAASAVAAHTALADPHPQYLTPAEGNAAYDALGAAASAVSTHVAASDPHPQYNTQAEGDARYERNLTAGANITIDRTNPAAPVISAAGGGGGGAVDSVNGQTGVVVLDADDIAEGATNHYYPAADESKLAGIESGAQVNVATDIAQSTRTATTVLIASSTGADATLTAASTTEAGLQTAADKTKLDGIATGATQNSSDAFLLARGNHTGSQLASTISDFAATVRATVLAGLSLADTTVVTAADTVLQAIGKLAGRLATAFNRANHTGTQAASTISDFASAARAQTEAELVAGTNITITPAGSGATRTLIIAASGGGATLPVVQAFSTRTLVLADINTFNVNSTTNNYAATIPPQSSVAWTDHAELHFLPTSTGNIVITAGAGVSLNGVVAGSITLSTAFGAASMKRIEEDSWWVGGVIGTLADYTNLTLLAPFTWDAAGDAADYHQPSYTKVDNVVRLRGKVTLSGTHTDPSTVNG